MEYKEIDMIENVDSFVGVGRIEDEIFKGIVVFENEFAVICEPRELNTAINEAYKMQKDVENLMIVIV